MDDQDHSSLRQEASHPAVGWQPIETAPRTDEEEQEPVLVLQDGRRFIATWDPSAGQWQGFLAVDGIERERYYQEWPGRLYSVTAWMPLPAAPTDQATWSGGGEAKPKSETGYNPPNDLVEAVARIIREEAKIKVTFDSVGHRYEHVTNSSEIAALILALPHLNGRGSR